MNVGAAKIDWRGSSVKSLLWAPTVKYWRYVTGNWRRGRFYPNPTGFATPVCVIGSGMRTDLFGAKRAIGQWLRIGDRRFRVIGIMGSEGRSIGVNVQETIMIPVASAQQLFNTPSLFRILVEAKTRDAIEPVKRFIIATLAERHQGEKDVTVITRSRCWPP